MKNKQLISTGIWLTVIALVGKLLGFLREILMAKYFGTSYIVDAYLMSIYIPSILFGWLPAIGVGYTPIYYQTNENQRDRFTANIVNISLIIALVFAILTVVFNPYIVRLVAPGFDDKTRVLTSQYYYITTWTILFNTTIQIFVSYLNCKNKFLYSNITNISLSAVQIIFVFLAATINIRLLPFGILLSYVVQLSFLFFLSKSTGYRHTFIVKIDDTIKELFKVAFPIFISNSLIDLNSFVDQFLGSQLSSGSVASLGYSFNLRQFVFLTFSTAISTMFYPSISKSVAEGETKKASENTERILRIEIIIFMPLTFGSIVLSKDIITCVYMRGEFDNTSVINTMYPFISYSLAYVFLALRDILIKVLYALKKSKENLILGAISIGINIMISLLLIGPFKQSGLALGTSISCALILPLYFRVIRKSFPEFQIRGILVTFSKTLLSSFVMGVIIYELRKVTIFDTNNLFIMELIRLGIIAFCGVLLYSLMLIVLYPSIRIEILRKLRGSNGKTNS